jgi:hypothetical protein
MGFGNPKHLFRFLLAFWAAHAGGSAFFFSLFSFEKLCWLPQAKTANTYKPSFSYEVLHHAKGSRVEAEADDLAEALQAFGRYQAKQWEQ